MKTLIIYTYPSPTGFNAAILKEVQSNLSTKHEVKTLDLYAENFDPILRFDQEHRRRDLHKDPENGRHTAPPDRENENQMVCPSD